MQKKYSRNFVIGISFIISIILLYFGINYLKGLNVLKKQNTYTVIFDDVMGLYTSSPIYLNGYQVGLISSLKMHSSNPIKFAVDINLEGNYRIPKGSTIEFGSDLLGSSSANINPNLEATEFLSPGDTILGAKKADIMNSVAEMAPKAESLMINLDSAIVSISKLLSNPSLEKSITGVESIIEQLNTSSQSLNSIMSAMNNDLPGITDNISAISDDLKVVSGELSGLEIEKLFNSISSTINNIETLTSRINSDDNSIGRLTNNTQLHDSLTNTLSSVSQLLDEIRINPKKYLSVKVKLF